MDLFDQIFNMMNGNVGRTIIITVLFLVGIVILVACVDGFGTRDSKAGQPPKRRGWRKRRSKPDVHADAHHRGSNDSGHH